MHPPKDEVEDQLRGCELLLEKLPIADVASHRDGPALLPGGRPVEKRRGLRLLEEKTAAPSASTKVVKTVEQVVCCDRGTVENKVFGNVIVIQHAYGQRKGFREAGRDATAGNVV